MDWIMSPRILLILCHPAFERSTVNKALLEAANELGNVTVHDLYQRYPDFFICVEDEQALLQEHDIIVFQHPFYWFSMPALLKEWQDLVLQFGFAFGPGKTQLTGKKWLNVVTAGGNEHAYSAEGHKKYSVEELLRPFECTAMMCEMEYLTPLIFHDVMNADSLAIDQMAKSYQQRLMSISQGGA